MIKIIFAEAGHRRGMPDSPRVPADDVIVVQTCCVEVADVPHAGLAGAARIDEQTPEPLAAGGRALGHEQGDRRPVGVGVIQRYQHRAAGKTITAGLPLGLLLLVPRQSVARWRFGKSFRPHRGNGMERPTVLRQLGTWRRNWER
jgi:hypothetical protein